MIQLRKHKLYLAACVLCPVSCVFLISGCFPPPVQTGNQVCFHQSCVNVELVQKPHELTRGLQFRKSLAKNSGMLFIFHRVNLYQFWMKDTFIALDIIWLSEDKKINYIARQVPPCREDPCPTYGPNATSRYVLEVNAGYADELGLNVGDEAEFRFQLDY